MVNGPLYVIPRWLEASRSFQEYPWKKYVIKSFSIFNSWSLLRPLSKLSLRFSITLTKLSSVVKIYELFPECCWPWVCMACLCLQNVCVYSLMSDSSQPPWIIAHQALPSMEFSRQEYWNGLSFPIEFLFTFCHKGGVICISEVIDISPGNKLEWVAISFSRGSSRPRDWTQVSRIAGRCFNLWATREALVSTVGDANSEILRMQQLEAIDGNTNRSLNSRWWGFLVAQW